MEPVVGQGPPRHVHDHEDECFYVLDGTVTIEHYFDEINNAASSAEQERIGAKYGIRLV